MAVVSTVSDKCKPEAAVAGIAVTENLEIIFDTVDTTRKYGNMLHCPDVALVIGWDGEKTVQYEGVARLVEGKDAEQYKEIYYGVYPDGRERAETWPGLVYFVVQPRWIRYSDFSGPVTIEEMTF